MCGNCTITPYKINYVSKKIIFLSIFLSSVFIISCKKDIKKPSFKLENNSYSNLSGYTNLDTSYNWILQNHFRVMFCYNWQKDSTKFIQTFKNKSINNLIINLSYLGGMHLRMLSLQVIVIPG